MKAAVLLLLFTVQLLHLEGLQIAAWSTMLRTQLQTRTLADAIDTTFSGKAPCSLCNHITRASTAPESDETLASPSPADPAHLLPLHPFTLPPAPRAPHTYPILSLHPHPVHPTPELPPPRTVHSV